MADTQGPNLGSSDKLTRDRLGVSEYKFVQRYPLDLGVSGQKNYTVFYINIRNRDLTETDKRFGTQSIPEAELSKQRRLRPEDREVSRSLNGITTLGAMSLGAAAGKFIGGSQLGGTMGGAIGMGVAAAIELNTNIARNLALNNITPENMQVVRLQKVIALPLMSRPSATYKADWTPFDLGLVGGLMQSGGVGAAADTIQNLLSETAREGGDPMSVLRQAANNPALRSPVAALLYKKLVSTDILGAGLGESIEKATSRTTNPFKEQLFKSMGFRTFTFTYTFLPKTRAEANEVRDIINTFKYYMHPGLSDMNYFMTYPAEFNIKYFYDGKESEFLHKIATCALTDLAVDYGSGNDFITFRPSDNDSEYGIPTEINLRLQFTELELLSKERVEQGY